MAIARRGLTLDEFLALPEEKPALEYANGMVTQKVAPKYEHSALLGHAMWCLDQQLRPLGSARILPDLRTVYAGRSYVPDLCVYRRERLPRRMGRRPIGNLLVPPDLAVEIISPGETLRGQEAKCRWYVENGVQVALLLDDRSETIRVFRPGVPMRIARRGERVELKEIATGLHLDVDAVFAVLDDD